jgi:DnaJ-class molecular chaperone
MHMQTPRHPAPNDTTPASSTGDEVPPGTPGTGEHLCRACGGTGLVNGKNCPECEGTGTVTVGVGGA